MQTIDKEKLASLQSFVSQTESFLSPHEAAIAHQLAVKILDYCMLIKSILVLRGEPNIDKIISSGLAQALKTITLFSKDPTNQE